MPRATRRVFLVASAVGLFLPGLLRVQGLAPSAALPRRKLGRTGRELPILGLGCAPIGNLADEAQAVELVRRALGSGARYFDTAPSYANGKSERRVGLGVRGHRREELFLATKTLARDGDGALAELEASLERLGTEYVDSLQVHEVRSEADIDAILAPGGVVRALESARAKGKLRHIGMSAHRDPAIAVRALERYDFATALVPINPLDVQHRSFVRDFLPTARAKHLGVIAMKVYAGGSLLSGAHAVSAADLVRFALAQEGVTLAVPGADTLPYWDEARHAAAQPLPDSEEQRRILAAVGEHQGRASEWYKRD